MSTLRVDNLNARTGTKITVPTGTTLYAPGQVIQVQQTVKTDAFSYNGAAGSFVDLTGLSVNITPTSSSSKIMVYVHLCGNSSDYAGMHSKIQRNGTDICLGDAASGETRCSMPGFYAYGSGNEPHTNSIMYLDSPATTSLLTYKIVISGGGSTVYINRSTNTGNNFNPRSPSVITVMEIGV